MGPYTDSLEMPVGDPRFTPGPGTGSTKVESDMMVVLHFCLCQQLLPPHCLQFTAVSYYLLLCTCTLNSKEITRGSFPTLDWQLHVAPQEYMFFRFFYFRVLRMRLLSVLTSYSLGTLASSSLAVSACSEFKIC